MPALAPSPEEMQAADAEFSQAKFQPSPEDMKFADEVFNLAPHAKEIMSSLNDRKTTLRVLRSVKPEQRPALLHAALDFSTTVQRSPWYDRPGQAFSTGIAKVAQPVAELAGIGGKEDEIAFIRQLEGIRAGTFAPAQEKDPWYQQFPVQATEMVPSAFMISQAGGLGGNAAKASGLAGAASRTLGLGRAAVGVGETAGITAAGFPGAYAQELDSLDAAGVKGPAKKPVAALTAMVVSATEAIVPNPWKVGKIPLNKGAAEAARSYIVANLKNYHGELREEVLQGLESGVGRTVATYLDENAPNQGLGSAFLEAYNQGKQAAGPLAVMIGAPASVGAAGAANQARLAKLQEIRTKGYVSAEDAQIAGIEGDSRKKRMENLRKEEQQLEQEIQNEVPAEAPTPEAPQAEVQEQPAAEVVPPEVLDQDIMAAILAAEKAAPEATPAPVQPKPPEVLAQGPTDIVVGKQPEAVPEQPKKKGRRSVTPPLQDVNEPQKTKMDLILDEAERSGKEMTVHVEAATPGVLKKAIQAATDRGLSASTDGKNLLIRPKPPESLPAAPQPEPTPVVPAKPEVTQEAEKPVKPRGRKDEAVQAKPETFTVTPAEDKLLGVNDRGEKLYERADGKLYRMRNDRADRPNGFPDFGGDLAPVEDAQNQAKIFQTPVQPVQPEAKAGKNVLWGRRPGEDWVKLTDNTSNAEKQRRAKDGWEVAEARPGKHPEDLANAQPVPPVQPKEPAKAEAIPVEADEPYKPPHSSEEVRKAAQSAEAARKRFEKRSGPMVPPPIRIEISQKIAEQQGRVDEMKEANRKYNEEYRQRAEAKATPEPIPAKPVEEKKAAEASYDFETTFPTPTEAAQRELIPGQHYPVPDATDDQSGEAPWFAEAAKEYRGHLTAAEQSLAEANVVRTTGKRTGGKKSVRKPEVEIKTLEDNAAESKQVAEGLVGEIGNIYGDTVAERFRQWASKPQDTAPKAPTQAKMDFDAPAAKEPIPAKRGRKPKAKAVPEKPKTALQQDADKATKEAFEELDAFGKLVNRTANAGVNPEVAAAAARVVLKFARAGFKQFQVMLDHLSASVSQAYLDQIQPLLEAAWDKAQASGKFPDMEPRVKSEAPQASGETTGSKNAKTDEARARAGMEPRPPVEPESVEEWQAKAAKRMEDPNYAPKLAAELVASPKALDPVEQAVMERYQNDLENRRKAGEDVLDEIRTAVEADERVGTIWGRAGVSRKVELTADFTVAGITKQHLRSVNKAPTDEQMQKYSEMADRISKLEGEVKETQEKLAQAEIDKQIAEVNKPTPAKKTGRRKAAEKRVTDAWSAFNKAISGHAPSGVPLDLLPPAVEVAKAYWNLGVVRFGEFMESVRKNVKDPDEKLFKEAWKQAAPETDVNDRSAIGALARQLTRAVVESGVTEREEVIDAVHIALTEMGLEVTRSDTMAAMSGYGDFRELSKDEVSVKIRGIKGEIQQLLKLEDMQAGQAPQKTGVERREPTEAERQLIKQVNEAKKKGGYTVTDPAKQLTSAMSTAKTAARNRIADLEAAIAKREKIVAGQTKLKPDAELAALQKQRDQLNDEYRKIFPAKKTGMSEAARLKLAEGMLDRQIAELKADLAAGKLDPKAKGQGLSSPEIEAKKLQLDLLKEAREQARAASPEYQAKEAAKQNARYKKSLEQLLGVWETRRDEAAAGKLPEKRKPAPLDNEILEKKFQIEQVKRETRALVEEAERAARSPTGKALGFGGDLLDLSQAIMTGYEMSAVLRQGAFYTLGFPKQALEAVKDSVRAAFSRRADFALHDDLMQRPNHVDYMRGGLETTAADGPLSHREELIRSRLASWLASQKGAAWALPRWAAEGLLGSERAFRTFANTMRADLFDYMKASVEASRTWSEDDAKVVGSASNVFSGRGELPASLSGVASSRFFFAPRWVWSRGQLLVGQPLWKGDSATRLAVGKVYVRAALGFGAFMLIKHMLYWLLAGDDDDKPKYELDPRSSDFGKMRVGETRIDSGAGLNQLATLVARVSTGETKRANGKIVAIRGEDVPRGSDDTRDVVHRFLDSKLAPLPSAVMDWIAGENVVGQKATTASIIGERVTPMTWSDIWAAEKELNVPQGTVAAIEAFFGEGVSTYGQRTKYRNADEEGKKKLVFAAFNLMDTSQPKRKDYGSDEKFQEAQAKFEDSNERAAQDLKSFGLTQTEAQALLTEYYLKPDSTGKRGSLREKDGDLKESYRKKLAALAGLGL